MGIRKLKPITPGMRFSSVSDFAEVTATSPYRPLLMVQKRSGGRNNTGRMTTRNIGGGHKQRYRIIDFKRDKHGVPAKVATIEYDPNRTARIALLHYADGEKRYIIAPDALQVGMTIVSGQTAEPKVGNSLPLSKVPLGAIIHCVELQPGKGAQMARSAGTYCQLAGREGKYAILKLPSGEQRRVLVTCMATIGTVSNPSHMNLNYGKAGRKRWLGRRPRVRGVAMNPVDHPMGGGEGRASGGHPRSRKGLPAKGYKTRKPKKSSNRLIISRRKTK
jgi:large subunit ribosomal protein L2